jgi:hypothetical protein
MKLTNAAKAFDNTIATDAYGTAMLYCQFDLYDDARRDGMTVERRIISAAPDQILPARRVVTVNGKQWILGDGAEDYFKGRTIRIKYVGHQASGLAALKTVEETLTGAAGHALYAATAWVKAAREIEISSELTNVPTLYTAAGEPVHANQIAILNGAVLWLRKPYQTTAGLQACVADELDDPWDTATIESRIYDPLTDSYTGAPVAATVLRMRWQEHFEYFSKAQGTYERGDCVIWVTKAALNVKINDEVTLSDGRWRVLRVADEGTTQSLQLRRA